jgi:hypothetical protein
MRIGYYLNKIKNGQSVNAGAFKKSLLSAGITLDQIHAGISFTSGSSAKLNDVEFLDSVFMKRLEALSRAKGTSSRNLAATQNFSHDTNVEGSFLLVRNGTGHPEVVIFDAECNAPTRPHTPFALIIENRQNFLFIEATSSFANRECNLDVTHDFDLIFGAGNEVPNALHSAFLSQYERIYMLFDYDAGGLQIAASLAAITPASKHFFVIPNNLENRLSNVVVHAKQETLSKVFSLGEKHHFLKAPSLLIINHKKTIEQESCLI